ncbi:Ribonuclease H-like domain containing protein [Trema orientale]|uniref:Ribonuclease H-like domain containing protein n=1 Tax=Trema orientale TaxID=63057 RepID=A0A2P5EJC5_TREOI|nr:Ribonuclease H-like domain containing protein [Trema orientale]
MNASVRTNEDVVGMGAVIRDHNGVVLAACFSRFFGNFSAKDAELIAIREGLRFAIDAGLSPSCVESDALKIVSAILSPPTTSC